MRVRVGIIFGGKSGEHEVSIQSAKNIFEALDREKYEPILLGVDKKGVWHLGSDAAFILNDTNPRLIALNALAPAVLPVDTGEGGLALVSRENGSGLAKVEVFFPIMHGTFGEDGSLQGLLRLLDAPFVGASVLGSAVGMDKDVMKRLLRDAGLPIPRFETVRAHEATPERRAAILESLGLPVFVKPCNLGSSVGISKVKRAEDLGRAMEEAFGFDSKVIVEEAVLGREIECAVLGNEKPEASVLGEIVPTHEFYSYEAKYIDENGARLVIPANVPQWMSDRIRGLALEAFKVLECAGMARVDFFLREDGTALINEINTLPGFTRISMYPKLWEASGLPYPRLLDRLIQLALDRHRKEGLLRRDSGLGM
ncbi:MAG: D-alanine--D-alanine ligase [Acidobacteriota bacterium]